MNRVVKCFHSLQIDFLMVLSIRLFNTKNSYRRWNIMLMQTKTNDKLSIDNHQDIRLTCNWLQDDHNNRLPNQELYFEYPHLREIHILQVILQNRSCCFNVYITT